MKPKFSFVDSELERIKRKDLLRKVVYGKVSGPYLIINKKKILNLSSNDYLGMGSANMPKEQMQSSSRLLGGNDIVFKELEQRLARHKMQQASLVFPTGYMANLGVISALSQKGDLIISDELNHASIIDACRLSHAKKMVYRHNDLYHLEKKLETRAARKFVITEGIFSMNGDFARLDKIASLCKQYNAILIVDDAHGDFVAGTDGRGSASHFGVEKKIDVYISSLSKGLGAFGGYTASKQNVTNLLINTSRPFIYTSALPNILASIALNRLLSDREKQRTKLWKHVRTFRNGLESSGYKVDSQTQIIPLVIGEEKKATEFSRHLFDKGIFAQPVRYPTVPIGSARIRISVTAWLTDKIIMNALDVFEKAGKKFSII